MEPWASVAMARSRRYAALRVRPSLLPRLFLPSLQRVASEKLPGRGVFSDVLPRGKHAQSAPSFRPQSAPSFRRPSLLASTRKTDDTVRPESTDDTARKRSVITPSVQQPRLAESTSDESVSTPLSVHGAGWSALSQSISRDEESSAHSALSSAPSASPGASRLPRLLRVRCAPH